MAVDLSALIAPVSDDAPAGADCTQGMEFFNLGILSSYLADLDAYNTESRKVEELTSDEEIAHAAQAREERKRKMEGREGDVRAILERAVSPNAVIDKVIALAAKLLTSVGKDLRVVQPLTLALTMQSGITGFADGLGLAQSLIDAYPEALHPLPDEDDPDDIFERINAVSETANGDAALRALRNSLIVEGGRAGRLYVRDVEVLAGIMEPDNPADPPSPSVAAAALAESGEAAVATALATLERCAETLAALARAFGSAVSVDRTLATVKRAVAFVKESTGAGESSEAEGAGEAHAGGAGGGPAGVGSVRSRADARRAIQLAVQYFEQNEPSHPAPLLLKRADRLMGMSFYEILQDMAPDAIGEIDRIAGPQNVS